MWDVTMPTDRTVSANQPDIGLHDKNNNMCYLLDVAIPDDKNTVKKEAEKITKYRDLEIEIKCMWNTKTRVITEVIGALGTKERNTRNTKERAAGVCSHTLTMTWLNTITRCNLRDLVGPGMNKPA